MNYRLVTLLFTCLVQAGAAIAADTQGMVDKLANFRFDKLGNPQIKSDSIKPVLASADRPQRLLILPITFADVSFERFAGDPEQEKKNRRYFNELLFAGGVEAPVPGTLSDYYRHQSRGRYNITGDIFPAVHLKQALQYYGRPVQNTDGTWRSDQRDSALVEDALRAAYRAQPDFPWRDYDQWDPQDFDEDGNRNEADGYLDHLVLIVAGKGQENCQTLYKLEEKLNENSPRDAVESLTETERACADRIWAHRSSVLDQQGKGPLVDNRINPRGGMDLGNGLWVADYNVQTEYTDASTFIHEFGHSIGLPDIYAAATSNSTGSWDVMSATTSPLPQEMSTWSRMVLGWLKPCVVRPPASGGAEAGTIELKIMNDWSAETPPGLCDAAMIILPPRYRDIHMGPLAPGNGKQAAYTGQGNDVRHSLSRQFDFTDVAAGSPIILAMDAWFEIEAEWDYLYVEVSTDGKTFVRLMPLDKSSVADRSSVMPAGKGHEGPGSLPGFTGLSGDRNGDGQVESSAGCNPGVARTLAEDKLQQGSTRLDPCALAQWIHAEFDLSQLQGQTAVLRFNYFTDGAAVENGALIDNVGIEAVGFRDDFEGESLSAWTNTGFTLSGGNHHLEVPHFYLLEYRDPYASFSGGTNYDNALAEPAFLFYPATDGAMQALNINYRPGLLMWYYNGEYLWSQNEPSELGPGNGFLLVVDANPQEFPLDALPQKYFSTDEQGWTAWVLDDSAQAPLQAGFLTTMCYQRRPGYYSGDITESDRASCAGSLVHGFPAMESLQWYSHQLMYAYTIVNELLPGPQREARKSGNSLFDLRLRDGKALYRLNDMALRNRHAADAPFSIAEFRNGLELYRGVDGVLTRASAAPFPGIRRFDDRNSYLNPRLPFGGASLPGSGFSFELEAPGEESPAGSQARINYRWAPTATVSQ